MVFLLPFVSLTMSPIRRRRRQNNDENVAATCLTGFFRCINARKKFIAAACARFARVWDEDSNQYFYFNAITSESQWSKPKFFLNCDAPLLLLENQNKRSPRLNRERIVEFNMTS